MQFFLSTTISRIHCISIESDSSSSVSSNAGKSIMVDGGCGRGKGRRHSHGRDSEGGRRCEDEGPRHYIHYGRNNHASNKC